MSIQSGHDHGTCARGRHRWLLGLEPFLEGGWLVRGRRAHHWVVEDELTAVALLGGVRIHLAHTLSLPQVVGISAWSIFRDVDVVVPAGTRVELAGRAFRGDLTNNVCEVPTSPRNRVVRIHGHALFGNVNVRVADHTPTCE